MRKPPEEQADAFISGAAYGEEEKIAAFLKKYPDAVNVKDAHGCTALWWAVKNGHQDAAELLLEKGADIDAGDEIGDTPLMMAAWVGYRRITEMLLENGADLNKKNQNGWTAEVLARSKGNTDMTDMLKDWVEKKRAEFLKNTDFSRGLDHAIPRPRPFKVSPR